MPGNTFGKLFTVTTCGESHGGALAAIIDGCPPGLAITEKEIQQELDRRKPGQNTLVTPRQEKDRIHILSGIYAGETTGAPILLLAHNEDMRPEDYDTLKTVFRPSHADYTWLMKYGRRDHRGSGRASARETLMRVAAGAIAKKYLTTHFNIKILAYVEQIGSIKTTLTDDEISFENIEKSFVRCPDTIASEKMIELIETIKREKDSIGGVIRCLIRHVPTGLGEPVFDKLSADLGKAMLSINAVKGFEIGAGFAAATMRGSEHNDPFNYQNNNVIIEKNHAGGILGGISSGAPIYFRVAFKPVATIGVAQNTINTENQSITLQATGRHDPCVLPRAVPIVEAMSALVLMDHLLRQRAQNGR